MFFYLWKFDLVKLIGFCHKENKVVIQSRDLNEVTYRTCMKAHKFLASQLESHCGKCSENCSLFEL